MSSDWGRFPRNARCVAGRAIGPVTAGAEAGSKRRRIPPGTPQNQTRVWCAVSPASKEDTTRRSVQGMQLSTATECQRKKGGVQWKKRCQDQGVTHCGTICGTPVKDILLDTGSTRTLVKKDLVPRNRMVDDEVAIRCAHNNTIVYPLADVEIRIEGQCFTVQAGVSDTLPVSVLLGRDVPELLPLVSTGEDIPGGETDDVLVVTMRAQAKKQTQEAALEREKELMLGAEPSTIEECSGEQQVVSQEEVGKDEAATLEREFADDIFVLGREKTRMTKKQRRINNRQYAKAEKKTDGSG